MAIAREGLDGAGRGIGSASVASSQVMPGSERNQVRWRLAKATLR